MKTTVALLLVLLLAGMAGSITPPGGSGDIEGVTVGAWLTGGGTSGSVTITGDSATIMTYIRARFLELTDVDGTTIELDGSNLLTVDTTSAKLAEMIQDRIGEMLSGNTETNVTVTYDDATNKVNFSVSLAVADSAQNVDTTAATAVALGEMIADRVGAMLTGNTETNITVTYDDADNTIDFVVTGTGTGDIEGVTAGVAVTGGGTSGTVTVGVDTASAAFDEAVSDRAGEMVSGNTETDIVVTYQDADNTVDIELNPDSIHTKAVVADTARPLNGGGLNLEGGAGGLKVLVNGTTRFSFVYDSLFGHGNIAKNFQSIESDSGIATVVLVAPKVKADTNEGADPTAPTVFATGATIRDKFIYMWDGAWWGLDSTSTRIELDTNATGTSDDMFHIPLGFFALGTYSADNLRGIQMGSNAGVQSDYGLWINQNDSGSAYPCSVNLNGTKKNDGTGGGDVYVSWSYKNADAEEMEAYSLGMDASDGYRFKLSKSPHSLTTVNDVMIVDSFEKVIFPDGLYLVDDTSDTDNKAASRGFVRQTEQIGITGGQVYWTPEPNRTVAKFLTNQWIDTTGTYTRLDSLVKRAYLWRATDTTASNDTLFVATQWIVDAPCSLLAVNYCGKTSSATAGTSSLDSLVLYVNGARQQGIKPAFASTVLDTAAVDFTNVLLSAGDLVTLVWHYVLGDDATADCKWATIERRKR